MVNAGVLGNLVNAYCSFLGDVYKAGVGSDSFVG